MLKIYLCPTNPPSHSEVAARFFSSSVSGPVEKQQTSDELVFYFGIGFGTNWSGEDVVVVCSVCSRGQGLKRAPENKVHHILPLEN